MARRLHGKAAMYRRLMVPLDALVDCQRAIPLALSVAARTHAIVELVYIAVSPALAAQTATPGIEFYSPIVVDPATEREALAAAQRRVEALTAEVERASNGEARVESVLLDRFDVAHAIAEHADQSQPDIVIMTTNDHSRLERLILGSVSESVVRKVHVPVVLVPQGPGDAPAPAYSSRVSVDHVLVPLDGSALAATVTPHAREFAKAMDARVTLLTIADSAVSPPPGLGAIEAKMPPSEPEAAAVLAEAAAEFRAAGIPTETTMTVARDRAQAILDFAAANAVDLIAMSTHGRSGIGRLVAGSVASRVLHRSPVPVLMFRPGEA